MCVWRWRRRERYGEWCNSSVYIHYSSWRAVNGIRSPTPHSAYSFSDRPYFLPVFFFLFFISCQTAMHLCSRQLSRVFIPSPLLPVPQARESTAPNNPSPRRRYIYTVSPRVNDNGFYTLSGICTHFNQCLFVIAQWLHMVSYWSATQTISMM